MGQLCSACNTQQHPEEQVLPGAGSRFSGDDDEVVPRSAASASGSRKPGLGLMLDAEVDNEASVSMTWVVNDDTGSMLHLPTGINVSPKTGITGDGHEAQLLASDIEMHGDKLGAGAGGVVKKAQIVRGKFAGTAVAVKTIKIDDKAKRAQLLNEIRALIQAQECKQLVHWFGGFPSKTSGIVHVVLEFMDLGSLRDLLKRMLAKADGGERSAAGLRPSLLACISWQVLVGLEFLHSKHQMHRDIKPENILHNTRGEVKITDFGISKELDTSGENAMTFMGTATYMSPERAAGEDYGLSSDIWSVGMVIYELASGRYPFDDTSSFPALYEALMDKPLPRLEGPAYTPELCDFVSQCLTRDTDTRPDASKLRRHAFVTKAVPSAQDLAKYLATL